MGQGAEGEERGVEGALLCEDEEVGFGRFHVLMSMRDMKGWTGNLELQGMGIRHWHNTYFFLLSFRSHPVR